jgi:hypothetical protein
MSVRDLTLGVVASLGLVTLGPAGGVAQGLQHFAVLSGGNEVSATGQAAAGDPDGSGAAALTIDDTGQVCVSLLVTKLDTPTAAHIHRNTAGVNGPIVVTLTAPSTGNPGNSSTCVTGLAPALVTLLRKKPNHFYINVHTIAFPDGALRGQLF